MYKRQGQARVGIVAVVILPELPQHIGHVGVAGGGRGGKGPQQAPVRDEHIGQQPKQQGREQIPLVHFHREGVHGPHQQGRAVKDHLFFPGAEHRRPAQDRGNHRTEQVQQVPGKALGQRVPVPADQAPEVVGVHGIKAVIVQGGPVALQQPEKVKPLGKGQGDYQHRGHRQQNAQAQLAPPPPAQGEKQVQRGKHQHLGLAGDGGPKQHRRRRVALLVEQQHRAQHQSRAEGIRLTPLGGVEIHRRAEQIGRRHQQRPPLAQPALRQKQQHHPAKQVRQNGGQLHHQGKGWALRRQAQEKPQLLQQHQHIQVAGRIVQEDVLMIDLLEPHLICHAGPGLKGVHIGGKALGGVAQRQPEQQRSQKQQAGRQGKPAPGVL